MQRISTWFAITMITVLLFGVVSPAAAQGPGEDDDGPSIDGPRDRGPGMGPADGMGRFDGLDGRRGPAMARWVQRTAATDPAALAEAFGITEAELQAFLDEGMTVRDIAQELDVNLQNVLETLRATMQAERTAALAEAFGISVAELEAFLDEGLTVRDVAQELGINLDNVRETLRAEAQAARNAALAEAFGISVAELEAYFEQGLTVRDVAQELDVNLQNVLEELGVQPFRGAEGRGFGQRGPGMAPGQ